jgi:hypothetical protein
MSANTEHNFAANIMPQHTTAENKSKLNARLVVMVMAVAAMLLMVV